MEKYVSEKQSIIDLWKNRLNCLFYWEVQYVYDGAHWCNMVYNVKARKCIIYACDVCDEEEYIIAQIFKLAFIVCDIDMDKKLELIQDLVSIVKRD